MRSTSRIWKSSANRTTIPSPPKNTASITCWIAGISGYAANGSRRFSGFATKSSMPCAISSTPAASSSRTHRRGKDRRVREDEAAGVEEIAHGIDDFVANPENRLLPFAAYPEMPAIQQVIDAVFFGGDGIVVRFADDFQILDVDLIPARRALVGASRAGDDHGGFLRQMV